MGTKATDVVACAVARIRPIDIPEDWQTKELERFVGSLDQLAPGLRNEMTQDWKFQNTRTWTPSGLLTPSGQSSCRWTDPKAVHDGHQREAGMALYREHVIEPSPPGGGVFTSGFSTRG